MTDLKQQLLKGGAYLVARQGAGMALSLAGLVVITRLIGPANYGLYAGALALAGFLVIIGRLGVDVYLVRREDAPEPAVFHQATALLALSGIGLAVVAALAAPVLVGRLIDRQFVPPLLALLPTIPLTLLAVPAIAQLDRALNYRAVAMVELGGQVCHYGVACALALLGAGLWAPVAGYWCWQGFMLVGSHVAAGHRPRLVWRRDLLGDMVRYGLGFSASSWIWQARALVNPIVVGRFLGPEGVAYVTLATRLVDVLGFAKAVAWRLSVAGLAKVQGERDRLRRGLEAAMTLEVLAVGPALAVFALVAPWVVPRFFGSEWGAALDLYPFVALGFLVNAMFSMQSSVLYVLKRNRAVALANGTHLALFAASCTLLVPWLGLPGYGWAEVVAIAGYAVIHRQVAGLFAFSYARAATWLVALTPPLFAVLVPLPWAVVLWIPFVAAALWPVQRRQLGGFVRQVGWRTA